MLLADMEDEYISELTTYTQFDLLRGSSIEDIANTFVNNILKNIFQHIHDNLEFYHTILQLERTSQLELKINEHIKIICNVILVSIIPSEAFQRCILQLRFRATISIIKYWVMDKQPISVDELAKHVHNIIFNGPLRIMAENRLHKSNLDSLT